MENGHKLSKCQDLGNDKHLNAVNCKGVERDYGKDGKDGTNGISSWFSVCSVFSVISFGSGIALTTVKCRPTLFLPVDDFVNYYG